VRSDYLLSRFDWLDNIGREKRSRKDAKLEDFLTQVQRLTLTHANPVNGHQEVFKFGTGSKPAEGNAQHTQAHGEEQKKKEQKRVDEGNNPPNTRKGRQDTKLEPSEARKANEPRKKEEDEDSEATKRESIEHAC
jgi:H+-transporting ATPase